MRLHVKLVASIALVSLSISEAVTPSTIEQAVRTIPWAPSPPIPERLVEGDSFVIVAAAEDPPFVPRSARKPREVLRQAIDSEFGTIAIVDVHRVDSALSEDETWVQTRFTAIVREVLRQGPGVPESERLLGGRQIEFRVGGGEVVVRGVRVRAGQSVAFSQGQYLVFIAHKSGPTWWTLSDQPPLALRNDRLAAIPPSTSALAGLKLSDVRNAVQRANAVK